MQVASADFCHESKRIVESFDATTLNHLEVKALAGSLSISSNGSGAVELNAKACTDQPEWLAQMSIDSRVEGDRLELTVVIPKQRRGFDPDYAYVDVDLSIPQELLTSIRDSSGDIHVTDSAVMAIDDGSGGIRVSNGRSDLNVRDSSGEVIIRGLDGNLHIIDSSGSIDIRDVMGNVRIPSDGSGEIDIEHVKGKVTIDQDGSGGIDIQHVSQGVEVGRDGSGGIKVRDVEGAVVIGSDGSGNVMIADVTGDVRLARMLHQRPGFRANLAKQAKRCRVFLRKS